MAFGACQRGQAHASHKQSVTTPPAFGMVGLDWDSENFGIWVTIFFFFLSSRGRGKYVG